MAPYSPRLMTSALGPSLKMCRAARNKLCSFESWRVSESLITRMSVCLSVSRNSFGRAFDPVIHGVERDDSRPALDLMQHRGLQRRIDIGQKNVRRGLIRFGQSRLEFREHVQFRGQRRALVHIFAVLPRPKESFPVRALEALRIDAAAAKNGLVFLGEIRAHDSDQIDVREITCGDGKISGRAAEHAVHLAVRRFHGIERNRSNDE